MTVYGDNRASMRQEAHAAFTGVMRPTYSEDDRSMTTVWEVEHPFFWEGVYEASVNEAVTLIADIPCHDRDRCSFCSKLLGDDPAREYTAVVSGDSPDPPSAHDLELAAYTGRVACPRCAAARGFGLAQAE